MDTLIALQTLMRGRKKMIDDTEVKIEDKVKKAEQLSDEIAKLMNFEVVEIVMYWSPARNADNELRWLGRESNSCVGGAWKFPWVCLSKLPKELQKCLLPCGARGATGPFYDSYRMVDGAPQYYGRLGSKIKNGCLVWTEHCYIDGKETACEAGGKLATIGLSINDACATHGAAKASEELAQWFKKRGIEANIFPCNSPPADYFQEPKVNGPPNAPDGGYYLVRFLNQVASK